MRFFNTAWIYLPTVKVFYNMDLSVIPECYLDTNLIETLVPPIRGYNHQKGCGTVTQVMQNHFSNSFAIGIIDKDKKQLVYLNDFALINAKGGLELFKHHTRSHFIIRILPAMERFILNNVSEAGINIEIFGLPSDFEEFKKITKTVNSKQDRRFKELFRELRKRNLADLDRLTNFIRYLLANPYTADLDVIKSM